MGAPETATRAPFDAWLCNGSARRKPDRGESPLVSLTLTTPAIAASHGSVCRPCPAWKVTLVELSPQAPTTQTHPQMLCARRAAVRFSRALAVVCSASRRLLAAKLEQAREEWSMHSRRSRKRCENGGGLLVCVRKRCRTHRGIPSYYPPPPPTKIYRLRRKGRHWSEMAKLRFAGLCVRSSDEIR